MIFTHSAGPFDTDGNVRCYKHQLIADLRTSNTDKNPERLVRSMHACISETHETVCFIGSSTLARRRGQILTAAISSVEYCPNDLPVDLPIVLCLLSNSHVAVWADELCTYTVEKGGDELQPQSTPSTWSLSPRSTYAPSLDSSQQSQLAASEDSIYATPVDSEDSSEQHYPMRRANGTTLDSSTSLPSGSWPYYASQNTHIGSNGDYLSPNTSTMIVTRSIDLVFSIWLIQSCSSVTTSRSEDPCCWTCGHRRMLHRGFPCVYFLQGPSEGS